MRYSRLLFFGIGDKLKESSITCEKCLVNLLGKASRAAFRVRTRGLPRQDWKCTFLKVKDGALL